MISTMGKDWRKTGTVSTEGKGFRAYAYQLQMNGLTKRISKRSVDKQVCLNFIEHVRLENIAVEKQLNKRRSGDLEAPPLTFIELLRAYSKDREARRKNSGKPQEDTLRSERGIIRTRIIPYIGTTRLVSENLDEVLERFQRELVKVKSEKTGKALSTSRRRKTLLILKQCLEWGSRNGYTSEKLLHSIELPTQESSNPREMVLARNDIKKLINYLDEKKCEHEHPTQRGAGVCRLRWLIALHTGRRSSEVLGMNWGDVFLHDTQPYFKVTGQLARNPWKHGCGKHQTFNDGRRGYPCETENPVEARYCPKRVDGGLYIHEGTKGGRDLKPQIPIDSHLFAAFVEHQRKQQVEIKAALENGTADPSTVHLRNLVFLQPKTLRPYGQRHDANLWDKILVDAGISDTYTPHQLRHTAATHLMEMENTEIKQVAQILGHKSILTTQKYIKHDLSALKPSVQSFADSLHGSSNESDS